MIMTGVGGKQSKQSATTMKQGRPENYEDGQLELDAEKSRFVTVAFVVLIHKVQGGDNIPFWQSLLLTDPAIVYYYFAQIFRNRNR